MAQTTGSEYDHIVFSDGTDSVVHYLKDTTARNALSNKIDKPSTAGTAGQVLTSDGNGGQSWQTPSSSGTTNYNELSNKPQIAGTTLSGNKTLADLGIASASDVAAKYTKPSSGIPASDLASGVIPDISGKIDKPSNPATGSFLVYSGSAWVAQSLSAWSGGSY